MKRWILLAAVTSVPLWVSHIASALEVDENALPRIAVDAELIGTLDYESWDANGEIRDRFAPNTDDSNVTFTLDKTLLVAPMSAGAAINLRMDNETVEPRVRVFLAAPRFALTLGSMRLRNTLVRFPTVREEDLLAYTHILNGSLGLEADADQVFGQSLVLDGYLRPGFWRAAVFSERRTQTELTPGGVFTEDSSARPNTLGASLAYDVPESVQYEHVLRRVGILYDRQELERRDGNRAEINAVLLGAVTGLNDDPEFPWQVGLQVIHSTGLDDRDSEGRAIRAATPEELARETATASVLSVHYANRQYLQTRWQGAITVAHKNYPDLSQASQWSAAPAWYWRLSSGLDLVAQAIYTDYGPRLAEIYGFDRTLTVQIGIAMAVEAVFNDQVTDYDSILEREHGSVFHGK
jgi:hypothetical protein